MTILRSREIVPKMVSKTPVKTLDTGVFEPETPAKTLEGLNKNSTASPSTSSPRTYNHEAEGLGSGTVRRRSLRLAAKWDSGLHEGVEHVKTLIQKRKRFDAEEHGNFGNGLNLGSIVSENGGVEGNGAVELGGSDVKIKMELEVSGDMSDVSDDSGTAEANESGLRADLGNLVLSNDRTGSMKKGRGKRKFGMDVDLSRLEVVGQDQNEIVLYLRSGGRYVKGGVKNRSGDSSEGFKSNDGDKLSCGNETGCMSNGCSGSGTVMNESDAKAEGAENDSINKGKRFIGEDKGKGKVLEKASLTSGLDLLKLKLEAEEADGNITGAEMHIETRSHRRKEKVVDNGFLSKYVDSIVCKSKNKVEKENNSIASGSSSFTQGTSSQSGEQTNASVTAERRGYKERFRDVARRNASRFAHFSSQEEEDNHVGNVPGREIPPSDSNAEKEDWPGPFSTAMKIIKDRQMNASVQQQNSSLGKRGVASVIWTPKKEQQRNLQKQLVPSLQDMCLTVLVKNADAITSLDCVPDVLRHKLAQLLCDSRRMGCHFFGLLAHGSPTEIILRDCSWLSEEMFSSTFEGCDIRNLTVLQLDQCGRCLPDYVLFDSLARSPNNLPALTTLSLRAAYRLSDIGLSALVSSAPLLRSINLSQCSLLTSDGICCLAASLGSVLRELYLDDCQGIDAMLILPALLKFEHLEVLSLSGIETVCDDFVSKFVSARGHRIKELVLADCMKLTDSSVRVIAESCPELCAVDLSNLCKLTDTAIGYLANGCRAIQTLKLCRNAFSDEAVAAYLETCGDSLRVLSLSNVKEVAQNTAISLSRHSRNLHYLDLSWCRNLTNEALGLVVDSCLSLKVLKVFGCTQITDVFLYGYSNPEVQIIGLKMKPLLEHLEVPDLLQGPLRYSSVSSPF